jgi:hypothetical protein
MTSSGKRLLLIAGGGLAAAGALLVLPAAWMTRRYGTRDLDGVTTLDDAVATCRRTGLTGWELVLHAQRLVYDKFVFYSLRNSWDTPARAFARGIGYCTQYNLALAQLLERLGFDVQPVYSFRVRVLDDPDWRLGHTWLQVTVEGETLDVCAGRADNRPGSVHFTPLAPVLQGSPAVFFLTNLGQIFFSGFIDWKALVTRRPPPAYMFKARPTRQKG